MRDTMKPLRLAIAAILHGVVKYNSSDVPDYDEKVFTGDVPALYILYSTQTESPGPEQNDCTFITESRIDIEIIRRTNSEVSKDVQDDVSNTIMELLNPAPGDAGFSVSGFQISYFGKASASSRTIEISPTESIMRKSITFTATLVQQ